MIPVGTGSRCSPAGGEPPTESPTARSLRTLLLAILSLGVLGTLAELLLLKHYELWWQLVPVVLLTLSIPVIGWCWLSPSRAAVRVMQGLMVMLVFAGLLGLYRHYHGNAEFELEMYPDRAGFELFRESLTGATPALAPASVSWLGLAGLAYAFRHPALERRRS